ncbi:hypothetical protein CAEBREN_07957 [Caenorhabditis brenneri]|uniref:Uncharacterized protein n=1 Tax=Caenorhabditis brenneri TaxID=135651 RepID=G0P4K2_CAEBE|nr:hypothetical protein CAEBREN_07957 [Caenorhabditis brenneri]
MSHLAATIYGMAKTKRDINNSNTRVCLRRAALHTNFMRTLQIMRRTLQERNRAKRIQTWSETSESTKDFLERFRDLNEELDARMEMGSLEQEEAPEEDQKENQESMVKKEEGDVMDAPKEEKKKGGVVTRAFRFVARLWN